MNGLKYMSGWREEGKEKSSKRNGKKVKPSSSLND